MLQSLGEMSRTDRPLGHKVVNERENLLALFA
jgi:hypothetical protein